MSVDTKSKMQLKGMLIRTNGDSVVAVCVFNARSRRALARIEC